MASSSCRSHTFARAFLWNLLLSVTSTSRFIEALKSEFIRQIGERPEENEEYPKLINDAAYEKCRRLAEEYKERIIFGGTGNRETRRFAPTLIYPVRADEEIVRHELFCPLLPIVPFKDAEVDRLWT